MDLKKTILPLIIYIILLIVLILDIVEHLGDSSSKLKQNQVASTLYIAFSILTPIITLFLIYSLKEANKNKIFMTFAIILNLVHYILTVTGLAYTATDISTTIKAYLYSRVTLLYIIIISLIYYINPN